MTFKIPYNKSLIVKKIFFNFHVLILYTNIVWFLSFVVLYIHTVHTCEIFLIQRFAKFPFLSYPFQGRLLNPPFCLKEPTPPPPPPEPKPLLTPLPNRHQIRGLSKAGPTSTTI